MTNEEIKEDWIEELKQDAYEDARQESLHEREMRNDVDYAIEHCDIAEVEETVHKALDHFINRMADYGWHDIKRKDVLGWI